MSTRARVEELLTDVLPRERLGTLAAGAGIDACPLAAPATPEEAVEVLRLARSEGWTVLPVGNGTKLGWARPPRRVDLALSSRGLAGVTAYEPDDGTITARAGTPWSELTRAVHARHHLSPELSSSEPATLGGVLVAGASGLDRLRHGPLRHQVLGMQALHADGSRVKSGGRVVKNVTGYDLHRLWCGSHGTLCFLLEATLRLYPVPSETAVLRTSASSAAEGVARSHALWRAGVQPLAAVLAGELRGGPWELSIVLAGRPEALGGEIEALGALARRGELLRGSAALEARARLRDDEVLRPDRPACVLQCRPSRLPALLEGLGAATAGTGPLRARVHPLLASVAVELEPSSADPRTRSALEALAVDGTALHWRGLGKDTPPARIPGPALELMQRVKRSLDPQGLFPVGRFHDEL